MGLDMYLNSKKDGREVGCWRKSNQIHKWFVDNIQNGIDECENNDVNLEQLKQLRDVCSDVLADHKKAEELLPPQKGFFFGSYDYDECYFNDLEQTVIITQKIIDECEKDEVFVYCSSW